MNGKYVLLGITILTGAGLWLFRMSSLQPELAESHAGIESIHVESPVMPPNKNAGLHDDQNVKDEELRPDPESLAGKRHWSFENAQRVTNLSATQIQEQREFIANAFYKRDTSNLFYADLHQALVENVGEDEADFYATLTAMGNWDEIKREIDKHQKATGQNYDQVALTYGLAYGDISAQDIAALSQNGVQLPQDAVNQLARHGQIDSIRTLVDRGILVDLNYEDPFTGTNALSALIQNIGYFPGDYDVDRASEAVQELIRLGVEAKPNSGALDPLDYALMVNRSNAPIKLAMARVLLEQGVPVEASHRELLATMPDGPTKEKFIELLGARL